MLTTNSVFRGHIGRRCAATFSCAYSSLYPYRLSTSTYYLSRHRSLSTGIRHLTERRRSLSSLNATLRQLHNEAGDGNQTQPEAQPVQGQKRKTKRSPPGKSSLRRVAVEAQRSKDGNELKKSELIGSHSSTKVKLPASRVPKLTATRRSRQSQLFVLLSSIT